MSLDSHSWQHRTFKRTNTVRQAISSLRFFLRFQTSPYPLPSNRFLSRRVPRQTSSWRWRCTHFDEEARCKDWSNEQRRLDDSALNTWRRLEWLFFWPRPLARTFFWSRRRWFLFSLGDCNIDRKQAHSQTVIFSQNRSSLADRSSHRKQFHGQSVIVTGSRFIADRNIVTGSKIMWIIIVMTSYYAAVSDNLLISCLQSSWRKQRQ